MVAAAVVVVVLVVVVVDVVGFGDGGVAPSFLDH